MSDPFKDMLNTWTPSERDQRLYEAGMEYEYTCEKYDQVICRRSNERGIAMPSTSDERGLCNRNAKRTKKRIMQEYNLTPEDFKEALDIASFRIPNGMTPGAMERYEQERKKKKR